MYEMYDFKNFPKMDNREAIRKYSQLKESYFGSNDTSTNIVPRMPRIVFVFIVNQRTYRQIVRLFKTIYDEMHFYIFHVDKKSKYLRFKMEEFMEQVKDKAVKVGKDGTHLNVKLCDWSDDNLWGGAKFFETILRIMSDLLELKNNEIWDWDLIFNMSESDFLFK